MVSYFDLRDYGPGKYGTVLESLIHSAASGWYDEETGDVYEYGKWYGLLLFIKAEDISGDLTPAEVGFIKENPHVIVKEDSDGFVAMSFFSKGEDVMAEWKRLQDKYDRWSEWASEEDLPLVDLLVDACGKDGDNHG